MKPKTKRFLTGITVTVLTLCLIGTAMATNATKTAQLEYMDIRVTMDGVDVTPKDVNGNVVEPFAINGTTFLPIRGVSVAAGIGVDWDQASHTVKLTSKAPAVTDTQPVTEPQYNTGTLKDSIVVDIKGWLISKDKSGNQALIVEFNVFNNSGTAVTAEQKIQAAAYQNGMVLKQTELPSNSRYNNNNPATVVPHGSNLDVYMAFALSDTTSKVEFELSDPVPNTNTDKNTVHASFSLANS